MTETNVNTSGQGTANWNLSSGTQQKLDPTTGKPVPEQTGTNQGGTSSANAEAHVQTTGLEEPIQDTVVTSTQVDANLYVVTNHTNVTVYTAPSSYPSLPTATINDPQLANQILNSTVNPSKEFLNNTLNNVVNMVPSGADVDLTPEEAQAVVTDPQILKLAEQTGVSPQVVLKNVQTEKNNAFQELVNKLPPDQAEQLTFAQYIPEGATNLSPELKGLLQQINLKANQEVAVNFKFSSDWPGVATNSREFRAQLSMNVDAEFTKLLNAKIDEGGLSASDAAMVRAMHNGMAKGTPTLKNILQQIQTQITTQLQAKYGFDVSYQPKGDVAAYNNIVNGDFAQTYQKLVAKYTGTATAEQRALLEKYAADPKDPSIPDSIKQLARQIEDEKQLLLQAFPDPDKASMPEGLKATAKALITEGVSAIVAKYGLDGSWRPTINALVSPYIDPAALKNSMSAMDIANEIFARAEAHVNAMPDSPEKTQYLEYLKVIGRALITIQDAIYGMQAAQSKVSSVLNTAQMEAQLNDIAQQQAAADEIRKKERKQRKIGPLLNAMNWIMKIAILAFSGPLFPLTIAYVVDSTRAEATEKQSKVQELFSAVANAMPHGKGGAWAAAVLNIGIATVLSVLSANPLLAINLFTQDSKFMESIIKGCGGNEDKQRMGGIIFTAIVQVALAACLMACTGGAAAAEAMAAVTQAVARTAQVSMEVATTIVKVSITVAELTIASMQIAASGVKLNNSLIQMQIDRLKGQSDAYSEQVQAIISILKKVVEKLLAILEGNSEMITNINTLQGSKWTNASEISSMICG